jgi:AhpD family alkylhydroperoxidase
MSTSGLIEYKDASPEVRAVFDDIMATRKTDWVNNFWKALAHDPVTLKRTWESIKQIMAPGAMDALTKEMIYVAVSVTNQCGYCIASHTASARKKGMKRCSPNLWPSWAWPTRRTGSQQATKWKSTNNSDKGQIRATVQRSVSIECGTRLTWKSKAED